MKAYKIIIVMFIFLFGLSFSCSRENGDISYEDYEIIDFNISCYEKSSNNKIDSLYTVSYDNLGIFLNGITEKITSIKKKRIKFNYYTIYADDIIPRIAGKIDSILVYSNNNYTKDYLKNESLNNIIKIKYRDKTGMLSDIYSLPVFLTDNPSSKKDLYFYLDIPPDNINKHIITIKYWETDGTFIEVQTIPITITP